MWKLITAVTGFILLTAGACWSAETVVDIVAVVNNEAITSYQLEQKMDVLRQDPASGDEASSLRQRALDGLIEESLLGQRAEELGMEVSEEELESAIRDIRQQNDLTKEELESALQAQGVAMEEYRQNLREQIIRYKVIGREVRKGAEVTSREIRDYFRQHIDEYRQAATLRLSRITVAVPDGASDEEVEKAGNMAEKAVQRIREGEDFTTVFLELSADPAVSGGDMGTFAMGELAPVFDRAVRDLEEGEVSAAVKFEGGYYIFRVEEKKPGKIRKFDQVEDEIRETLLEEKSRGRQDEWKKELREKAFIEIR